MVLTAAGSAIWNPLLIGAGMLLGTQWQTVEEHIDVINDLIHLTIGVSLGVFFMRRWTHRRRQRWPGTTADPTDPPRS